MTHGRSRAYSTILGRNVSGRSTIGNVSTRLAVLAAGSAAVAYYVGGLVLDVTEADGFSSEIAEMHERLGKVVTISLTVWALIRVILLRDDVRLRPGISYALPAVAIPARPSWW